MKKFFKDNPYFQISLYMIFVVIVSILFYRFSSNTDNIAPAIMRFISSVANVLMPIIYGLLIAYILNPIMIFFEGYYHRFMRPKTPKQVKGIRTLSIVTVYLCIIGVLIMIVRFLGPQIYNNLRELFTLAPTSLAELNNHMADMETTITNGLAEFPFTIDLSMIFDLINPEKWFNPQVINNVISGIMGSAFSVTSALYNWIMGLVIAFYLLTEKENFTRGAKKVAYAIFQPTHADRIIAIFSEGNEIFNRFFVGKFIDSTIIGVICFLGLSILRNPYALLIAIIVGIFNMIPYFGPILGAIPAIIITLFTGIMPAIAVAVFIVILQQFDGLVLGPKILGNSIGLGPFWIISGIIIGGALWGPLGMFFASPIVAVILNNLNRWVTKRLKERRIKID